MMEFRTMVPSVGAAPGKACRRPLGVMGIHNFLIWVAVKRVSSLCENVSSCYVKMDTFFCVYVVFRLCLENFRGCREVTSVMTLAQGTRTAPSPEFTLTSSKTGLGAQRALQAAIPTAPCYPQGLGLVWVPVRL